MFSVKPLRLNHLSLYQIVNIDPKAREQIQDQYSFNCIREYICFSQNLKVILIVIVSNKDPNSREQVADHLVQLKPNMNSTYQTPF